MLPKATSGTSPNSSSSPSLNIFTIGFDVLGAIDDMMTAIIDIEST